MSDEIFTDYIEDIPDAMEKAEILPDGVTLSRPEEDFRISFAVTGALEIMGEATKRLPMSLCDRYPDIPWKAMAGIRDRIIHGYDRIDYDIIWNAVKHEFPQIRPMTEQVLKDHEEEWPGCPIFGFRTAQRSEEGTGRIPTVVCRV